MIFRTLVLSVFALTLSVANADLLPLPTTATIYEDAEQGNASGWDVYDQTPTGATITNVLDSDANSNVIELSGDVTKNGYRLGHNNANNATAWGDTTNTIISWDSKFSESMVVYVPVQTTNGFRYLYYTARNSDLGINTNPTYVHHGIGANQKNGLWHRTARDLQADLQEYEPDNQIISVNGVLIRGSGRVDNIATLQEMPPTPPVPDQVMYEDAENGDTVGWDVYDKTPEGATFTNVVDADKNSKVIEISGDQRNNGFRLGHNNANSAYAWNDTAHKVISWDGKFDDHMVVYIPVQTTFGFRYLYYTAMNSDRGIYATASQYIHHGIGANRRNGEWHTTARDLEADLKEFEPDNELLAVNGFLVRGNGQLDNIQTSNTMPVVPPVPAEIIYEDAENGNTVGWDVYDKAPDGATFANVDDSDSNSKVIELSGSATSNGYRLGHNNSNHPNAWYNKDHRIISWDGKFSESMVVYIPVQTTNGFRYLYYTAVDTDKGFNTHGVNNTVYIHYGIGTNQKDGTWHTNVRDLQADLEEFEPGNLIETVNGILIRGSGRVDNIKLSGDVSPPESTYEIKFYGDALATTVPRNLSEALFEQDLAIIASVVDADGNTVTDAVPTYDISTVDLTTVGEYSLTFSYSYTNDSGDTVTITKDLPVIVENHLPSATGQTVTVDEDTSDNPITLTGSDSNVGDTLTYAIATPPTNGTLSGTAPNLTYTPTPNFAGTDSFTFTLSDNTDTSSPATVTINVTDIAEPNSAPVAVPQSVSLNEDGTINITLLGTDADGDPLHYAVTSAPTGSLSGSTGGTFESGVTLTYAPSTNYFGTDSFTFTVNDGTETSAPATVNIEITSVNDVPTIGVLDRIYLPEDSSDHAINLVVNDVEGDTLTYTIDGPSNGVLGGTAPNLTYTPNENYWGMDSFTVTVSDGTGSSARTIDITVNSINDAPTVNAGDNVTVQVNSAVTLTGTASDVDGGVLTYQWFDGETAITGATSAQLSYTPSAEGTHILTLTVADNGNPVATASDSVEVAATLPEPYSISLVIEGADFDVGTSQAIFEESLLGIGAVEDDQGNNIPQGNNIVFATEYSGTVDLNTVGTYYIQLEYTDPFGRLVQSTPIEIRVNEAPVVINPAGDPTDITFDFGNPLYIGLDEYDEIFDDVYYFYLLDQMHVVNDNGDEYTMEVQDGNTTYYIEYDDYFYYDDENYDGVNLSQEGSYLVRIYVEKETYDEATNSYDYEIILEKQLEVIVGDDVDDGDYSEILSHVVSTTGEALSGVRVDLVYQSDVITSDENNETDLAGNSSFYISAGIEMTLVYTKAGYADQVVPFKTPLGGSPLNLEITMIPRAEPQAIPATGEVTGADGAKVIISGNSFVDAQGNPVSIADGISVTITPVDVSTPVGVAAFPGEFSGVPENQTTPSPIVSYGTVEYVFRDSSGNELQLAVGQEATIEIPLFIATHQDGTAVAVDDSIPLWSLDELTGIWTQEGTGTVVASGASPTGFALQATVSHFTWWNADAVMNPAYAIVTVTAPDGGTALIKIRTDSANANGWRSDSVSTVIPVGSSTGNLPIPSNSRVCFWAVVTSVTGMTGTTEESCATVAPNTTENISLEIVEAPLELTVTPSSNITAYINVAPEPIMITSSTSELTVDYVIESGNLPAGVSLVVFNATTASIVGEPTEAGIFNPVIKGTDADGNEFSLPPLTYTVIDGVEPPSLLPGRINRQGVFEPSPTSDSFQVYVFDHSLTTSVHDDLNLANDGGDATNWSVSFTKADLSRKTDRGVNSYGYDDKIQDVGESEFNVLMDPATGVLTIDWPNDYLASTEARLISLYFTLTATNAGGSSSVELFVWKQNDGDAVVNDALPKLEEEYNFGSLGEEFLDINLGDLNTGAIADDWELIPDVDGPPPPWLQIVEIGGIGGFALQTDEGSYGPDEEYQAWSGIIRASNFEGYYDAYIYIDLGGIGITPQ